MYRTLPEFLTALDASGELHRVTAPVSSILEITEIADRVSKSRAPSIGDTGRRSDPDHDGLGGRALLFERVEGSDLPVAINLFGSYRRMEMALGCHEEGHTPGGFDAIGRRIAELTKPEPPRGLGEIISKAGQFLPLLRIPPRSVRRGRCQEIVRTGAAVNLLDLPIIKCWPLDGDLAAVGYPRPEGQPDLSLGGGRFITFAGMYTIHADDAGVARPASRNIGMYRAQVIDERRLAMHWHMHHDGAAHWRSWKRRGEPMPIAIVLGGESVLPYAATAPLPPGISELLMAGFLNRGGIPLVRCKTVPLSVPANAEIVIEGLVSTEAGFIGFDPRSTDEPLGPGAVFEGPFGDHTGFYSLPDRYPVVNVTAITTCRNPMYPTTIVGLPPQEDYYLGKATERIFLPLLKTIVHDIEDYHLPLFGCFHNCAVVQIDKQYPLQARRVMHAVWGAGQMAWTKVVIVVDREVDVHRLDAVLEAIARNCRFDRDFELVHGPLDILDHAAPHLGAGGKIGIDATRKIPGEEVRGAPIAAPALPRRAGVDAGLRELEGVRSVSSPPAGLGRLAFVTTASNAPGAGRAMATRLLEAAESSNDGWPELFIVLNDGVDATDTESALFHWTANHDPSRDLVTRGARVAFDATAKHSGETINRLPVRDYPPLLRMSDEIRERVDRRWREYGFD
ncbi:MAG: UbiD family decarboxylase [Phycisphaerales bacterium]